MVYYTAGTYDDIISYLYVVKDCTIGTNKHIVANIDTTYLSPQTVFPH